MKLGEPQRLVGVDIPDARDRPLVEKRRLDRRPPTLERPAECGRRECSLERLAPDPRREVFIKLTGLEEEPRAETPHVAIGELRPVVQRDECPPVLIGFS